MISITKKNVTITIEEKLLEKAKKNIPNISEFVTYCLKNYLGEIEGLLPIWKQEELLDTIAKCQLELYLMNEKTNIEENMRKAEKEKIDLVWRKIYKEYRVRQNNPQEHLDKAAEKLGVPVKELMDILDLTYAYSRRDRVDITDWDKIHEAYGWDSDESDQGGDK